VELDTNIMPLPVAKALGQKLATFIYGLARSVSTKPGSDGMGRTRRKKYHADVEFIDAHSDILPKLISTGIDTNERREVVKRLQCWHQVAQSSPVDQDPYLQKNPGLLPLNIAELLTSSERKDAIDLLAEHKRQFHNPEQEATRVQSNSIYMEARRKELERRLAKDAERAKADLENTTKPSNDSPPKQVEAARPLQTEGGLLQTETHPLKWAGLDQLRPPAASSSALTGVGTFTKGMNVRVSNKQSELAGFEGVIDTIHGKTCLVVFGPRASKVVKTSHLEILSSQNSGVAQPEHPSSADPKKAKLDSSDGH